MLSQEQIAALEEVLEQDRYQKQLLQELFNQILDDDHGIPSIAYDTLCELADSFGLIFEGVERVGGCDGRVYLKEQTEEDA